MSEGPHFGLDPSEHGKQTVRSTCPACGGVLESVPIKHGVQAMMHCACGTLVTLAVELIPTESRMQKGCPDCAVKDRVIERLLENKVDQFYNTVVESEQTIGEIRDTLEGSREHIDDLQSKLVAYDAACDVDERIKAILTQPDAEQEKVREG